MDDRYTAGVATGALHSESEATVRFPHRWTSDGVTVHGAFTGAHLLHMAIAGCVLNDLYREAAASGVDLRGVRVSAEGGFDTDTWASTGITYSVEIDSDASTDELARLLATVDEVAEIPRALRAGTTVRRTA
jgi:uncharacterized OsmC-like protein